jgi:hypothetical protein
LPRGYLSLTALKGLAIAKYLGYQKIFTVGLDASLFQTLSVDHSNRLFQGSNHVAGVNRKSIPMDDFYPNGMMDYFFDTARYFFHVKKYFSDGRFYNLDPESFTDGLLKSDPLNLLSKRG